MKRRTAAAAVLAALFGLAVPVGGEQAIALQISPRVAMAPAYVRVDTTIEPDDQNRALEVTVDSAAFYRSSQISLDGARAPRLSVFEFPGLPSGTYVVTATVVNSAGTRTSAVRSLEVVRGAGR